ncbi:MAG: endonuclease V [bacterium]
MKAIPWANPKTIEEARVIQEHLRSKVVTKGEIPEKQVHRIAGVDASITRDGMKMIGVICLLSWPGLELEEIVSAMDDVTFPYVPGYLSFREIPVLLRASSQCQKSVDLAIVDGQGIAHPRRLGLASHLGLVTGWTTIGCAKSRLIGIADDPGPERGARSALYHGNERIGTVVRTRVSVSPVWVSVGTGIGLADAEAWILRTARSYRLPEPVRCAHREAGKIRERLGGEEQADAPSKRSPRG